MNWTDLPPLGTLVAFEATYRLGGVTKAAEELHLTHGAVSRQIQQLERAVGVPLFERRHRAMAPTPAATALAATVTEVLGLLGSAVRQARRATRAAPLVLSCEPTLLMRWLIPLLPALPEPVHLFAAGGPVRFSREGIDVAIRRNDFELPEGVHALPLFDERIGPVCTPELARDLASPADLSGLARLHTRTRPSAWTDWARLRHVPLGAASEHTFEHFYLSLEAATAGLGVAIGPFALVANDLATGKLVAPFGFEADGSAYVLLTDRPPAGDPRVSALHAWLLNQAGALAAPS